MTVSLPALLAVVAFVALIVGGGIAAGTTFLVMDGEVDDLERRVGAFQDQMEDLREEVRRLSYNTASGGGLNVKLMLDPVTGEPTVPLAEVFSFDRNHAMCRVDTNPQAFKMWTHEMGRLPFNPTSSTCPWWRHPSISSKPRPLPTGLGWSRCGDNWTALPK